MMNVEDLHSKKTAADREDYKLEKKINSENAAIVEKELLDTFKDAGQSDDPAIVLDASELEYISSAGLRMLLRVKNATGKEISLRNVSRDIYDIFDLTGFTLLLDVQKRMRRISIDNAREIGRGGNAIVYRLDSDTIVKVYYGIGNPLEKIEAERLVSRAVFTRGINTAIPYDVVEVGDSYGLVFEMVEADTLSHLIIKNPDRLEEYTHMMAMLLKQMHSTEFEKGTLPDARNSLRGRIEVSGQKGFFTPDELAVMRSFVDSIPSPNTFVHGDFHPGNIMIKNGDPILIDVGESGLGHPINDLMGMAINYVVAVDYSKDYCGIEPDVLRRMWPQILREYFETEDIEPYSKAITEVSSLKTLLDICTNSIPDEEHIRFINSIKGSFFDNVGHFVIVP